MIFFFFPPVEKEEFRLGNDPEENSSAAGTKFAEKKTHVDARACTQTPIKSN